MDNMDQIDPHDASQGNADHMDTVDLVDQSDIADLFKTLSIGGPTFNLKKCYAALLEKTIYPYITLNQAAQIHTTQAGCVVSWGNLYIGMSDVVYVTQDESDDHKYSLECGKHLLDYLDFLSCVCKTPEELIMRARIPTQDFMFAHIAYARQTIERLDIIFEHVGAPRIYHQILRPRLRF